MKFSPEVDLGPGKTPLNFLEDPSTLAGGQKSRIALVQTMWLWA